MRYRREVANEERLEKEIRFAQRVQAALLPTEPWPFHKHSRGRLDLDRFPDAALFHRLWHAVCRAACLPSKKLYEAWRSVDTTTYQGRALGSRLLCAELHNRLNTIWVDVSGR